MPQPVVAELLKMPDIGMREQRGRILTLSAGRNIDISGIVAFLASKGCRVEQFKRQEASLEEMYTTIVRETEH